MAVSTYSPPNTKIVHTTGVDFTSRPSTFKPIHLVQYDNKLPIIAVALYNNGQEYALPSTADANIRLGKPGRKYVYNKTLGCSNDRKILYFEITQQMVTDYGTLKPVVELIISGEVAASSAITFLIEKNPVQEGDIESSSEGKAIVEYAEAAQQAAQEAKKSETASKTSQTAAEAAAKKAETAKSDTETLKSDVQGIKDAAVSETTKIKKDTQAIKNAADAAKTEATKKATEAATSADIAKQYSGNPAIVGSNNNWWIWNADEGAYEDSGKRSILAFDITYASVSAMEADVANQKTNTVAIISSDVNVEDNAKLYIKNADGRWYYLADLSGFTGNGISKWEKTSGNGAPGTTDTYTVTFTDGRDFTYTVYNGKDNANDATITIQKNGETVGSFTTDQADDADINVEIVKDDVVNALGYTPAGGQGVNLILQSNVEYKNSNYNIAKYESSVAELEVDKPYTVTYCVTPAEGVTAFSLHKNRGYGPLAELPVSGTNRQIISATFTCPSYYLEGNYAGFHPDIYTRPNDGSVTGESIIHWIKVERGTVTDPIWTPAPEDVVVRGELEQAITGNNLISDSTPQITKVGWNRVDSNSPITFEGDYAVCNGWGNGNYLSIVSPKVNVGLELGVYTLSFTAYANKEIKNNTTDDGLYYDNRVSIRGIKDYPDVRIPNIPNKPQKFVLPITVTAENKPEDNDKWGVFFFVYNNKEVDLRTVTKLYIKDIKLEKGINSNPIWIPSPYDYQKNILARLAVIEAQLGISAASDETDDDMEIN